MTRDFSDGVLALGLAAVLAGGAVAEEAQYPKARWVAAAETNYTKADKPRSVQYIIIHTIEGSKAACLSWFKNPRAKVCAHFVVGFDGEVIQMVKEEDIAWHAGHWDYNTKSIGIEHEGFAGKNEWTMEEYKASAALTAYLCKKYKLPIDREHIIGHVDVPKPNTHWDPGKHFDWDLYLKLVKEGAGAAKAYIAQKAKTGGVPETAPDRIAEWWKLIDEAHARKDWYAAARLLRRIAYNVEEAAHADKAKARLAEYQADAAIAALLQAEDIRRECECLLSLGRTYAMNGLLAGAVIQYQKLVDLYPDSPHVAEARKQIDGLNERLKGQER